MRPAKLQRLDSSSSVAIMPKLTLVHPDEAKSPDLVHFGKGLRSIFESGGCNLNSIPFSAVESVTSSSDCVISICPEIKDNVKLNDICKNGDVSFIWCSIQSQIVSLFCHPKSDLFEQFKGHHSRQDGARLIVARTKLTENQQTACDCSDLHYLSSGDTVTFFDLDKDSGLPVEKPKLRCEIQVLSEESILVANPDQLNLEGTAVKLAFSQNQQTWNYLKLEDSLKNPVFSFDQENQSQLHKAFQIKSGQTIPAPELMFSFAGKLVGNEIASSIIQKTRLPLHQWVHVDVGLKEAAAESKSVIVIGDGILKSNVIKKLENFQGSLNLAQLSIADQIETLKTLEVKKGDIFILAGGDGQLKRETNEFCKSNYLVMIDVCQYYESGFLQSIVPYKTCVYDTVVDIDDEKNPLHCLIKSYPNHLDHCILWAKQKVDKLKEKMEKQNIQFTAMQDAEEWARAKYDKLFVEKPRKLVEQFPVAENPNFWNYPKRKPREDMLFEESNSCHKDFIAQLSKYGAIQNGLIQADNLSELKCDLILTMTKLRAELYFVPSVYTESQLESRCKSVKECDYKVSQLLSEMVAIELLRLATSLEPKDWWFTNYRNFGILKSSSTCSKKTAGKLSFSPWDNIDIRGSPDWTLENFLQSFESTSGLSVNMVAQGAKIIYIKAMPTHKNRLKKPMTNLMVKGENPASLTVTVDESDNIPLTMYSY